MLMFNTIKTDLKFEIIILFNNFVEYNSNWGHIDWDELFISEFDFLLLMSIIRITRIDFL